MFRKKKKNSIEQIQELSQMPQFLALPGLVFFKDQNCSYISGNLNFLNIAGLSTINELIGKTDQNLPWKQQSHSIMENDLNVLRTGKILQVEEILSTDDNVKIFITIRQPIKDLTGDVLGLSVNAIDITAIKTLEHQLQQDKTRIENEKNIAVSYLNNIVACTPGNLYWKDLEGKYLGVNEFFLQVAGLNSLSELLGKTDLDLPWKKQYEELRKNDLYVMQTGNTINAEEIAILADQTHKTFMAAKMPLKDIKGNIIGMVGNSLDITTQKEAEKGLFKAKEQAEVASRAKTIFLQNMRHDFRTPFVGILGMADILYENETDRFKKDSLQMIVNASQVLLNQLNEITDFISLEDGSLLVLEKQFDLYKAINDVKDLLLPILGTKYLKFDIDISNDVNQFLIGDLTRTQRILINLLSNSVKFTNTGTILLHVSLCKKEKSRVIVQFTVEDTGIGMSQEQQNIIFEKFSRLTPSHQGVYSGKGLGLRIVKQFLDELNGEIHVSSRLGNGSKFVILIPYKVPLLDCNETDLLNNSQPLQIT